MFYKGKRQGETIYMIQYLLFIHALSKKIHEAIYRCPLIFFRRNLQHFKITKPYGYRRKAL